MRLLRVAFSQHDADALRTWLGAMNGFDDRGVTLEPRAGFGWCAAATRAIRAGESLVQVPGEAFLTAATAAAPGSVCASLLQEADEQDAPLSEWQVRTRNTHLQRPAAGAVEPADAQGVHIQHTWPRAVVSVAAYKNKASHAFLLLSTGTLKPCSGALHWGLARGQTT